MSSRRGGGRSSFAALSSSSPKGSKSTIPSQGNSSGSPAGGSSNSLPVDQMSQEMSDISIDTYMAPAPHRTVKDAQEKDTHDFSKHFPHGSTVGEDDSGSENEVDMLEEDSDDFDSDGSVKSHGTRKKNKWFKAFFDEIDKLRVEEITEPSRLWNCPACRNGPGAIDWYQGLQPLMAHAKTKGASRVKAHRELAQLLDEELSRRGPSTIPAGEVCGKWNGLPGSVSDHEIVWPPMTIVMNTKLKQHENGKWLGMGKQELLNYFSGYNAVKARHSYGPQGHRGMSVLIFESSAIGYLEAERLHKHFSEQGRDRDAWDQQLFFRGGQRQLYGYMARKEDVDSFNKHFHGKSRLKYDMRSYIEMVVEPMRQLGWYKDVAAKEESKSKALKESLDAVTEKLRESTEVIHIMRQRTKMQHEKNKEEMDLQEQFFKDQITTLYQTLEEKERDFEEHLQKERKKVKESNEESRTKEERKLREEEIAGFIETQDKGVKEFEAKKIEMTKMLDEKMTDMKQKRMWEYPPQPPQDATGASTNQGCECRDPDW
ncbi:hypothetical protein Sjap_021288 [Stephania japonica]|uniref:Uncharacterized protein n=1 Tax=Stephania japonica TaxID=461633 RepID=A0AAP0HTB9_9MAGN